MKHIIVCIVVAVIGFSFAPHCYGESVTVDFYQSQINSKKQTEVLLMKNYVRGVLDGTAWANADLVMSNKKPLYCQPENFALSTSNAIQIIDQKIKSTSPKKDLPIGMLLLLGLEETFPCK